MQGKIGGSKEAREAQACPELVSRPHAVPHRRSLLFLGSVGASAAADAAPTEMNISVEVLTPLHQKHETPVIMVHGDYHTGAVGLRLV